LTPWAGTWFQARRARNADADYHVEVRGATPIASDTTSMKRKTLRFGKGFNVVLGNKRAQAAQMVLEPGKAEGHAGNRHGGADQWLFVVSGDGVATINGRRYPLRPSTLLLIEHGDRHEIRNTGRQPLKTLNIYVPPAYTADGDELPAGEPAEKGRRP
jgi:mannose-6-phosphate isomerase-like protein (cupin superfamily)